MDKKTWIVLVVVVLVLVAIAKFDTYYPSLASMANFGPTNLDGTPKNSEVVGSVVSSSADSLTVQPQGRAAQTFTVSGATPLISQVASGQVGKTFEQLTRGTQVLVVPGAGKEASLVSVVPVPPPPPSTSSGKPASITGNVFSINASTIVIGSGSPNDVTIKITKNTAVYSQVLAGQTGKTLADIMPGITVQVDGTSGANGAVADSIVLMTPVTSGPLPQ